MSHHRITWLRLSPSGDWERVQARLQALVADAGELATVEDLRLVRVDEQRGVLIAACSDAEALARISDLVIDPWLDDPDLAEPSTVEGEALFSVGPPRDRERSVDAMEDAERLEHFVTRVTKTEVVWGLYSQTWARSSAGGDQEALPVWPEPDLAARCIAGPWRSFTPRRIELDAFVDQWLTGMHEDGIVAVVSPTPTHPGTIVKAVALADALRRAVP